MRSVSNERRSVNAKAIFAEALAATQEEVVRRLTWTVGEKLQAGVSEMLQRQPYERREEVPEWVEIAGQCQRCQSRQSQRFSRNGGRGRTLLTSWGVLVLWMQRLVCVCGGTVRLELDGWLQPYQRVGEDVDAQIRRWGELRLSLREMQQELVRLHISPLALRTLNRRLQQVQEDTRIATWNQCPPVLQVDAIWLTQLVPTGAFRLDAKGRRRPVKQRCKRPLFIAFGVWPDTNRAEVLAWRLADKEDETSWLAFLTDLEALGVRGENGLELIIHDGGAGLCTALRIIHFAAAEQRCLFHKLRNLYQAIRIDDPSLSPQQLRRRRKAIFRDFYAIWDAKRLDTVLHRYFLVVRKYRASQPQTVKVLRSDFRATIACFLIHHRHPTWDFNHLRTTSRLERFNRRLRRRTRAASAYHSDSTIAFMLHQELASFHAAQA